MTENQPTAPFYGRKQELQQLTDLTATPKAKFVVIKGRRRVGKSRLAREFAQSLPKHKYYYLTGLPPHSEQTPQGERDQFAQQLHEQFAVNPANAESWDDLLNELGQQVRQGQCVLILDEINWIAKSDPTFSSKLWRLWEMQLSTLNHFILIVSGSLASWIDHQFSHNTGYLGRISWNMTLDELPLSDTMAFFGYRQDRISFYEQLKFLLVTGGIPRYLEEMIPSLSAEENIRRLCFDPAGLLFNEFHQLFNDLFQKKYQTYKEIVEVLADKPLTNDELHKKLKREKSGVLTTYIKELEECGFVMRLPVWNLESGKPSNRYKIRVVDSYVRFYLKAITPNIARINAGDRSLPKNFLSLLGYQFENLIIKNNQSLFTALRIDTSELIAYGPYFQTKTSKQDACQIDYLIHTKHSFYVVELKFNHKPVDTTVIEEVEKKVKALKIPPRRSVRTCLVTVNGVSDSVSKADYFDHLIEAADLVS